MLPIALKYFILAVYSPYFTYYTVYNIKNTSEKQDYYTPKNTNIIIILKNVSLLKEVIVLAQLIIYRVKSVCQN